MIDLPPFPVDDDVLDRIEEAINTHLGDRDESGNRILVGGEFTLTTLLDFYSGYDGTKTQPVDGHDDIVEYIGGPIYHRDDVIRALIAEIRRLRKRLM